MTRVKRTMTSMIKDIVKLNTYKADKMIIQKFTLMWMLSVGVMHSMHDGEHYTFMIEFGPLQVDWTIRFWKDFI